MKQNKKPMKEAENTEIRLRRAGISTGLSHYRMRYEISVL